MLDRLKHLDLDRIDVDEAVYLVTLGESMKAQYTGRGLETPEWLVQNTKELDREIRNRQRDNLEKAKKETIAALDALKTPTQRREELQAKLERLNQALGG